MMTDKVELDSSLGLQTILIACGLLVEMGMSAEDAISCTLGHVVKRFVPISTSGFKPRPLHLFYQTVNVT